MTKKVFKIESQRESEKKSNDSQKLSYNEIAELCYNLAPLTRESMSSYDGTILHPIDLIDMMIETPSIYWGFKNVNDIIVKNPNKIKKITKIYY